MQVVERTEVVRQRCNAARAAGQRVALVPTMGALHAGHMALVAQAQQAADFVVVSIFVNPTQFGAGEDLASYPRPLEADLQRCRQAGVDVVFTPARSGMYPAGDDTRVSVGAVSKALCGAHRPGHFVGVATIVTKLLALVGPCIAVFGRKDYQQLCVIRRFVRDLFLPAEIVGAAIVREADGLALSSRNVYLSEAERVRALSLAKGLTSAASAFETGERGVAALRQHALRPLEAAADSIDYVTVADADDATPLASDGVVGDRALLAVAARIGRTRLIDNVVLGEDPPPLARR